VWRYVYRAIDQDAQVIDIYVSNTSRHRRRGGFFRGVIRVHGQPCEVVTDRTAALAKAIGELAPGASHNTVQYANNRVKADHSPLKARLRPMRGLKRDRTASIVIKGHAFIQNIRRGHYELGTEATPQHRLAAAFDDLLATI
jgi:IS6 family transposase